MKNKFLVIAIIIAVVFGLGIIKDLAIKSVVTMVVSSTTGAPVEIKGFSFHVIRQNIKISGFKIFNPKGFPKGVLIDIPKIEVSYNLGALLKKKIHLKEVVFDLKELVLIKNEDNVLNVDSLKVAQKESDKKEAEKAKPSKQMPIQIDVASLNLGRVILKDYTVKEPPQVQVYDININKTYKNITSVQQLVALIVSEPMKAAGIKGAAIYGVSVLAGAGLLPVAVAATLVGKDSSEASFALAFDKVYDAASLVLNESGKVKEDKASGVINATIDSVMIKVKVQKVSDKETKIVVSARKYLLPRPEIASGIIYKISQKLK